MHVHIATAGENGIPIMNGIKAIPGPIDKIYLICGEPFIATSEKIQNHYREENTPCEIKVVNGFDFQEVIDRIHEIYQAEYSSKTVFTMNITGGTNLMTAAACSGALLIGAKLYYVLYDKNNPDQPLSERLVEIPHPKVPDISELTPKMKETLVHILTNEENGRITTNSVLVELMQINKSTVTKHIHRLEDCGYVVEEIDPKNKKIKHIELTEAGRMVAKWI